MAKFTGGTTPIDLFDFDAELQDLDDGTSIKTHTATQLRRDEAIPTDYVDFFGTKFTYDGSFNLIAPSTVTRIVSFANTLQWDLSGISLSDAQLDGFITAGNGQAFLSAVFAGNDSITGSTGNDTLQGFGGNDSFNGGKGDDVYHVDDNKDVVTESLTFAAGGGTDLVISKGTFTLGTNVDNLQLENGKNADGTGNAINNTLTGNAQDNKLTGLAGDDSLVGNAGNDTLDGGTNTATVGDTMVGGEGDDLYVVDSAKDQVIESGANVGLGDELKTNQNTLLGPLANIEHYTFTGTTAVNFIGDAASNRITGAAAADNLQGGSGNGNDTLIGLAGNDSLNGFGGDDVLDGGAGIDEMRGGTGNDIYVVDNAKDLVSEGVATDANDTVRASITVTLASFVGIENIELTGTGALNATGDGLTNNKLTGNAGANKLDGLGGDDTMDGGKGNDTYVVDSTTDQVAETDVLTGGLDTVLSSKTFTLTGAIENLTLTALGPTLDIDAFGNALVNTLTGNDGKNVLDGGALADKLLGGKGDDTYIVDDLKDTVTESVTFAAGGGIDLVKSAVTFTLGTNLDKLELTGTAKIDGTGNTLDNTLTGNGEANKLSGLAGADSLLGNGGNDTLDGGTNTAAAGDTLEGGLGDDLYIVDSALDVVNPDTGGTDELKTNQQFVPLIAGIENYTFTGTKAVIFDASNDSTKNKITGTAAADTFDAKGGDDSVAGLAGNDTLTGGAGNDSLDGGAGTDSMDGGAGDDSYTIDNIKDAIADSGGTDTVVASVSFDLSAFKAGIENASLTGTAALNLTGDDFVNKLIGNAGANKIDGKGGADDMIGGAGSDTYTVDNLGDKVTETDSKGGTDLVLSSVDFTLGAFLENLTLTDIKDVNGKVTNDVDGTGNELANLITGNGAANILKGGATDGNDTTPNGNDTLIGNGGDDSLSGGAGADSLSGGDGNDTLDGGAGAAKSDFEGDKMAGGAGDDVYFVNTSKDTVTEAAGAAAGLHDTVKTTVGHTLGANVEDMVLLKETTGLGNGLNNIITGSEVTDTADDKSGDDFINGFAGNDTLLGMGGDDEFVGNTGNDSIDGGDGIDIVQFTGKIDDYEISVPDEFGRFTVKDLKAAVNGNDGTDTLINVESLIFFGTTVPVTFDVHAQGTDGPDTVPLTSAPDGFDGLKGDDSIDGDGGADTLEGNEGNDTLIGGTGDDQLKGGTGADQYNHAGTSVDGNDVVSTGDATTTGLDKLVFTGANLFDLGFTRDGNNLIVGAVKSGQTTFDGQVLVVDHYNGAAIASVVIDTQFNGFYGTDPNQAKFVFTTDLDSGVNNADYTEVLLGSDKSDLINGNGGFLDILVGNAGNDTLNGGTGTNVVDYRAAEAGVTLSLLAGKATVDGDGGQDTLLNIQNVRGSQFDDDITGDGGDNVLEGGKGNDALNGGEGRDQVVYTGGLSAVTINLTDGTASGGTSVGEDNLDSIERVLGSQFSDTITGKADIFAELTGSKGNDTIDGAGNGYANYYDSPGAVTANLATGTATDGWGTTDTLKNLVGLTGSDFADKLTGNANANTLDGGAGSDTLTGGTGNDSIVGGLGTDTAVFSGKSSDYLITDLGGGTFTVKDLNAVGGDDGTDTLSGIEALQFTDQTIDGTNTAPVNSVPAGQSTNEDTTLVFSSGKGNQISISDVDADGFDVQVTLHVDHGALTLATLAGLTSQTGNGTGTVTLVGSITEINAALNGLGFAPTADFNGSDTLTITTNDKGNTGAGGALEDKDTVAITINPVNDAPIITSNGGGATATINLAENVTAVTTVTSTDVDVGQTPTYSISGGADQALFTINGSTGALTFVAPPDFEGAGDNSYQVIVQVSDGNGGTDTQTLTVNVTDVNEASPVITSNGGGATATINLAENGTAVTDVNATDADTKQTLTYSISGGADAGDFTINATTGVLAFVAPPNFELPADTNTDNSYEVIVQVSDGNGGTDTQTLTVNVTDANEASPVIGSNGGGATATINVAENSVAAVTDVNATDADTKQTLTYSISGGADAGDFTINPTTGVLAFAVTPNAEAPADANTDNSYEVIVQVSDGNGGTDTQTLTVNVTDVNEFTPTTPTDSNGAANTVAENAAVGATVGITALSTDADLTGTITYSLTDSAGGKFSIDSTTGVVKVASALDAETATSHNITVQASDGTKNSTTQLFTINVTDVNEFTPTMPTDSNVAANTVAENAAVGATVGITALSTDSDLTGTITYSLTDSAGGKFSIDATTGVVKVAGALDAETASSHNITVQASDGTKNSTQGFTINVTDVNEFTPTTPTDSNVAANTVAENAAVGATVGITALSTDSDLTGTITYSLTDSAGGKFSIDSSTGVVKVAGALDAETATSHNITVQASDGTKNSATQSFTINVTDVNEFTPTTPTDSNGAANTVAENVAVGATVGITALSTDSDLTGTITYSLTDSAGGKFSIDSATGVVKVAGALDFETASSHNITVQASDGTKNSTTQVFAINVTDVNEASPIITSNGGAAAATINLLENGTAVTDVNATDADTKQTLTHSISGGADQTLFTIDSGTGVLVFKNAPDFENPTDANADGSYLLTVQVSDGKGGTDTQDLTVTLTDANEASPVIGTNGGGATATINVAENFAAAVTDVNATDADTKQTLTYSISGGADNEDFTINPTTGVLEFAATPNFEAPTDSNGDNSYEVIVQASDGTKSDTQTLTVNVTDVNEATPVITSNGGGATATINVAENAAAVTDVDATDADTKQTLTYSISGGADQTLFTINASTGVLVFKSAPDFEGAGDNSYEVIVQASDGNGGTDTQTLTVNVTDVNEASPVINSNGGGATATINMAENATAVTDVDATDADTKQTLTYSISGGADQTLFTINSSTGVLAFKSAPDFEGAGDNSYEVIVQASDGTKADTQTLTVNVTDVNEATPVIGSNGGGATATINVAENTAAVTDVDATDADTKQTLIYSISGGADQTLFTIDSGTGVLVFKSAPDFEGAGDNSYEVIVQASDGTKADTQTLTVNVTDVNEATPVIGSNGGGATATINVAENTTAVTDVDATDADTKQTLIYSISGGADQTLFTIDSGTGVLVFKSAPDFEGAGDNSYEVIVQASDGTKADTQTLTVNVTDVNEATPVIGSNGGGATATINVAENTTAVTDVDATDADTKQTLTYSISGGADQTLFTIDSGTGVLAFKSVPDFEGAGDNSYDVIVQASDGTKADTQTLTVNVTDVNEATPVITSNSGGATATINVAENTTAVTDVDATDADTKQTLTYSISGGADQTQFTINSSTGVLVFKSAPDFEGAGDNSYEVIVQASDGTKADTQTLTVNVTDVNEALPVIGSNGGGATATINVAENTAAVTDVDATDADTKQTLTYSISGGADQTLFTIDSGTGVLVFKSAPDFEGAGDNSYEVIVQASDGNGGTDTQTLTVNATDINEASPIINSNGGGATATINVAENTTAVTDVDATDADTTETLTYSISGGADQTLFTINSTTGVLAFKSAPDFEGAGDNSYEVIVQASDGTKSDTQTLTVNVTDVNEATPVISSNGGGATATINVAENTTAVTDVDATDADTKQTLIYSISGGADQTLFTIDSGTGVLVFKSAPDFEGAGDNSYEVIVQASDGTKSDTQTLTVNVTDVNEATPVIGSNGGGATATINVAENTAAVTDVDATDADTKQTLIYSISGGADQTLFTIDSGAGVLAFKSAPDFEGAGDNSYEVIVQASDGTKADTQTLTVNVTDVNEATPVIGSNGGGATATINMTENTAAVTDVDATDADTKQTLIYSISGGADQTLFTIDSGTGVLVFKSAPDFEGAGDNSYEVIVQASDGTKSDTQTLTVNVTDVNEATPVIGSNGGGATATINVTENTAAVTDVDATDADTKQTLIYSISGGADQTLFTIDSGTGVLVFKSAPDFEGAGDNSYEVIVQASDGTKSDTQTLTVNVTDVNEASPVIGSNGGGATATINVTENTAAVTDVDATDADTKQTLIYSISGGADQTLFTIDSGTGVLVFKSAPDFEGAGDNSYEVIVQASDGTKADTQTLTVNVTDVNEATPVIGSNGGGATATINMTENTAAVTDVDATDADTKQTLIYSISGGADQTLFTIDSGTGVLVFKSAPDFEGAGDNSYEVIVQASDGTKSDTQTLTVNVTDVNEATPVIGSNGGGATATINVTENTAAVTDVDATDADTKQTLIYSISGGADQTLFTIDSGTGVLVFKSAPDFEGAGDNSYEVIVQASDGTKADTQTLTVNVTDVNEATPVIGSNGGGATATINMTENTAAVTDVDATDADTKQTLIYSISGGADQTLFTIDSGTGVLVFKSAPDFEGAGDNSYEVIVQASDGTKSDTQTLTVNVTDVNEATPVIGSNGGGATATINVTENTAAVTDVDATDADTKQTLIYSISGGADQTLFTIDSGTGVLVFKSAPDFEGAGDNSYEVIVQASDGTKSDTQTLTVNVTDVNEASPVISSDGGGAAASINVAENTTAVTDVNATDADTKQTLTYSITGDDSTLFTIDSGTGLLAFKNAPDFENAGDANKDGDYLLTVHVSDGKGGTDTQDLTITVTEVTDETLSGDGTANKLVGGIGDDSLSGNGGNDTLIGGADNDSLLGGAGTDNLLGGSGDDTLAWDGADSALDGGDDNDALLVQSGDLDLMGVTSVANIEQIDLGLGDPGHQLTLSAQDVLDATDGGNTLTITGDSADTVNLDVLWLPGTPSGGQQAYTQVVGLETATLVIDTDIQVIQS